jgi:NAD(P)H-dependent FMN reductase
MTNATQKLQIIVGSTRAERVGIAFGRWIRDFALESGGFDVDFVDLAELALPFMDEPKHPRFRQYVNQHTRDWSARVDAADAFVFVTPENNHGFPGTLKNAIDYLHHEWQYKPAGLVSYGGVSAGTRAAEMLKQVLTTLKMVPIFEGVAIPFPQQRLGADGSVQANDTMTTSAAQMLAELKRWSTALRSLRAPVASG